MRSLRPLAVALVVILATGLVHGVWTERWKQAPEITVAGARLAEVPLTLGDWKGANQDLDEDVIRHARVAGYWARVYTNPKTKKSVSAILMCGRAGPIAVHRPNECYGGAGYEMAGAPIAYPVHLEAEAPASDFWTARFRKEEAIAPTYLRIFWSWNANGVWTAAPSPRFDFARTPVLYKLYLLREMGSANERLEDDPCVDLLKVLLPAINGVLGEPRA
jgi:hypothetical protein